MYIEANKEASLPDKNQYNSIKSSEANNRKQINWQTVSEFKEKINKLKNDFTTSKKEDCIDGTNLERKKRKLNFTNCWEEDLTNHGYARCLRSRCNFISNNIRIVKSHYKDCIGVPRFTEPHFCSTCQNYLYSSEAHAEHVPICKGFNKYNQRDYKYEKGLRPRKIVSKVPLERFMSWKTQILHEGLACCGYKMCTFVSMSLSDLEEHYITCCGVGGVRSRCCACRKFKFSTEDEYAQHKARCPAYTRLYHSNLEGSHGYRRYSKIPEKNVTEIRWKKPIVQPKPEAEPGVWRQQRTCTQQDIRSWKRILNRDKCVRCSLPKCNFIAMSLEDMIRHFSYCNEDENFAKVVCPYCKGRVTSRDVLKKHIERTHSSSNGIPSKVNQEASPHVTDDGRNRFLENDQMERVRRWQMQFFQFGHAYCPEFNCNFVARTLRDLHLHVLICKEISRKKFTTCRKCETELTTEQLVDHRCHEDKSQSLNEREKLRCETSPVERERRDFKTYSRKRKVDLDLNNEYCGNLERSESCLSNKVVEWNVIDERSQVEVWDKNEVEVLGEEVENVERRRTSSEFDCSDIEVLELDLETTVVEFGSESDKSEIEIIEERLEKAETKGSNGRRLKRNEIEMIRAELEGIETVDIDYEEEEKNEMLEDEEVEKVETVKAVDVELESEDEEPEKVETVEDKLKKLLEDDEPKTVEVDECEEEELVKAKTVDSKKDEAEKPEDRKEDTPGGVILEDSEREESKKDWDDRKEDESEKDDKEEGLDSFGLDESEEEEEDHRMEIDEGVMSTIFETLDDDFDQFNPPYSIVGNEIEVFEGNENSQETVIVLPNDDSQSFLINEDTGTLDRSEPASTDSEQVSENEEAEDNEGVEDNGQEEESQGVEQSGEQNDDTSSDDSNDSDSGKESDNGQDERKKKDDEEEDDGDGKKSENRKEVEKSEESDNAEEGEEKDIDDDEEIDKNDDRGTKESNKRREKEEGSSKVGTKTEKPKEGRKTRKSGKIEGSGEIEKDKVTESRKSLRRSKKWSEDDGNEEYIPKGSSREGDGSEDESETIAKPRGRRGRAKLNNEVSVAKSMESQEEKTELLKCGKCDFKGNRNKFDQHNWTKHSGLAWVDGEKEVDLNDVEEITRLVRTAFKVTKKGVCEVCKEVKKSYLGFVSHVQKCGKSQTEMDALKVQCPHCSTKCLKYCLKNHIYIYHSGREVDKAKSKNKDDTDAEDADAGGDVSKDVIKDKYEEKVKTDEDKESDNTTQESVVSSSKRKSALRAVSKFQEAFKDNTEQAEEEEEKAREPGYFFYEKGGKLPKLCYQLVNLWYALKRKKKMIPCRHQDCNIVSSDVKEAKLHHFTCSHFPSEVYLCELCDYYSVSEPEIQSHVKSNHRRSKKRGKGSKEDVDTNFADNEGVEVEEDDWEDEEEEEDEEEDEESENDFEGCDSVFERQNKKKNKKNRRKGEEYERRMGRKRMDSDSEEDTTEIVHKQNFCEREKLENLRGDEFYSNALEMTREFEESYDQDESESSQTEDDDEEEDEEEEKEEKEKEAAEEEVNSEIDHSGVWPQLHTKSEDWCRVSSDVSSAHLPEILESISVSFLKGDKTELNWRRFKRFEGDLIEDVPALFVGGSVRSLSWCKVSFRRALEKSVRQYLAVSTSKNIDHLTDVHKDREPYSWSLVQIWDCGALENSSPVEPPKFCLGLFQEGGEIWDMLWFPEDTYGRGSNGKLIRIGVLATAADDGAVRIWSICEPSQIAFNTRLPLFITEPLVKLIIDNFLEDSCVRLSIGRDGIIAGGYVNGCLAVWNLKNITSPFSDKIGKCIIIKPHLIIQAHRTSITALTFCPNNNRYITSGGLDRVVKLWDLESPWVPVEQYQRELCLDNIWPRNWPMNIHNFEDVYPNNRKGVVRFVKGVVSSKHSPCLILDNTCLSLSFSDWLNSICGCNNTGEVKIRFLKNFLRDQDKKHEKNQSTLSSLRLEKLNDEDDSDWESSTRKEDGRTKSLPKTYGILNAQYGIVIKDHNVKDKGRPLEDAFHPEDFPIRSINKVCFNPNFKSFTHIAVGYNCGLVRILRLNELQFNHAIRSFSENAKKPRL